MNPRHTLIQVIIESAHTKLFDELALTSTTSRQLAIRLAHGTICRENIMMERHEYSIYGAISRRHGGRVLQAESRDPLQREILALNQDLKGQKPDEEYVPMTPPPGRFSWRLKDDSFRHSLSPANLYPLIEKHVSPIRESGLRVTGYIEISEKEEYVCHSSGFALDSMDYGVTMTFTVDRDQQATGVGKRSTVLARLDEVDQLIGEALEEAAKGCLRNSQSTALAPGDYTVILSPSCVANLLSSALHYGLFDRRKIDEGRTFLSGKWRELTFPAGLRLTGQSSLELDGGKRYSLPPFNQRRTHCRPMNIIRAGGIQDLHTTPFWARKNGLEESHTPFSCITELSLESHSPMYGRYPVVEDLIKDTSRGIYVADLWYLRIVAEMDGVMTGMTRDGVFEIVDGKLGRPLKNMRWHDNPIRLMQAVTGVTSAKRVMGVSPLAGDAWELLCHVPNIRVEKFHFSSETRF